MPGKNITPGKKAKQPEIPKQDAVKALSAICGILVSGVSIDESLGRIASITSGIMNARACSVMIYDSESQELSVKASRGGGLGLQDKVSVRAGTSLAGLAIKEKKIVTSLDMEKNSRPILPGTAEFSDISSMISAPIMYGGVPIGVINSYNEETHVYTDDEKSTMQVIADQSAAAIQLAKFGEEAAAAREALKDRKIIEKAKGILMKQRHLSEDQAYRAMRSKSMDTCKPMKEVAEAIILADEIRL